MKENIDNLQYNSCVSKGVCSVNPRTAALQNVLVLYLHLCAKYCLKLYTKNALEDAVKETVLNTTAIAIANPEFTENCFMSAISDLKKILSSVIDKYNGIYKKEDFKGENIFESDVFKKCENIVDAIKLGETIFRESVSKIPAKIRNLFKIMLLVGKSISINIIDLKSFNYQDEEAFGILLNLLNSIKSDIKDIDKLKNIIYDGASCNTNLMKTLHEEQEKKYGKQGVSEVSYTTIPSKAVLVVGSNIRELEIILEKLRNTDIDVYTHDDMMIAHTFPEFKNYKNLKGQFGYGVENCLIDFATFPGPIIITKHSLHNIENLYRGRLFTTDINYYKGVIKIENYNLMPVIKSAQESKGFKRGKTCETVTIGYNYEKCIESIEKEFISNRYKRIVVIGLKEYSEDEYFTKLVKLLDKETLIISFSYNIKINNLIHFNACFDSYAVVRIFQHLLTHDVPISIFLPKCGRNTIAEILHFKRFKNVKVFLGECEPVMLNPSLLNTLDEVFDVKTISNPKENSAELNNL